MRVRVTVTLDVDPVAWAWEYGLANVEAGDLTSEQSREVRADVQRWSENLLLTALHENGLAFADATP